MGRAGGGRPLARHTAAISKAFQELQDVDLSVVTGVHLREQAVGGLGQRAVWSAGLPHVSMAALPAAVDSAPRHRTAVG